LSSGFCGCEPKYENHCKICPGELPSKVVFNNKELLPANLNAIGFANVTFPVTCELILSIQYQLQQDNPTCAIAQYWNFICGSSNGLWEYAADTPRKRVGFFWAPRVSAILSLIGALAIIADTVLSAKKGQSLQPNHVNDVSL
jgi:hypothetical protein